MHWTWGLFLFGILCFSCGALATGIFYEDKKFRTYKEKHERRG